MNNGIGDFLSTVTSMSVEPQAFKEVMARWASGVTIATTCQAGAPVGMTVTSFTTLSLHPQQILICANRKANTHAAIVESGFFAVNLLAVDQMEWGIRFAGLRPEVTDRFEGIAWLTAQTGAPILPGVLGWLDCHLRYAFAGGDHTIFVGEVAACGVCSDGGAPRAPLLYYRRNWRRLEGQGVQTQP
jgi:flavin reductase (DIM6/NTAB) family NADH-FMN oxidoreductase RutF